MSVSTGIGPFFKKKITILISADEEDVGLASHTYYVVNTKSQQFEINYDF